MPETLSRTKSAQSSGVVYRSDAGIGFPSANRALATIPRNLNDANGYYRDLGLDAWATTDEIRRVLRHLFKCFHPDGSEPDPERFRHFLMIAEVLLDPDRKRQYDSTPADTVFIDPEVREMMDRAGIPREAEIPFDVKETIASEDVHYDFFAVNYHKSDIQLANEWYRYLLRAAPAAGYTSVIKVLLWDDQPQFGGTILYIPRKWKPSLGSAFALLRVVVN